MKKERNLKVKHRVQAGLILSAYVCWTIFNYAMVAYVVRDWPVFWLNALPLAMCLIDMAPVFGSGPGMGFLVGAWFLGVLANSIFVLVGMQNAPVPVADWVAWSVVVLTIVIRPWLVVGVRHAVKWTFATT